MKRDIQWGAGGGLLMILLGHVGQLVGLIGGMQAAPLIAGGATLLVLTALLLMLNLRPRGKALQEQAPEDIQPRSEAFLMARGPAGAVESVANATERGRVASSPPPPGRPAQLLTAGDERPIAPARPEGAGATRGLLGESDTQCARVAAFRFRLRGEEAIFSFDLDSSDADAIARKAVRIAREWMTGRGIAASELRHLEISSVSLDPGADMSAAAERAA
jgi:hypothetical protein